MSKQTIALYCGSFNPFHVGHLNILRKAEQIFGTDNVYVFQGNNPGKVTTTRGIGFLKALRNNHTGYYNKFTHEIIQELEEDGYNVVLVRGLRNGHDLSKESDQLEWMKGYKEDINICYIPCDKEYEHISSTYIKQTNAFREGSADKYIVL